MGNRLYSELTMVTYGRPYYPKTVRNDANAVSYARVVKQLERHNPATLRELADAVPHHPRKGGGWGFVVYLLRRGWLQEVERD